MGVGSSKDFVGNKVTVGRDLNITVNSNIVQNNFAIVQPSNGDEEVQLRILKNSGRENKVKPESRWLNIWPFNNGNKDDKQCKDKPQPNLTEPQASNEFNVNGDMAIRAQSDVRVTNMDVNRNTKRELTGYAKENDLCNVQHFHEEMNGKITADGVATWEGRSVYSTNDPKKPKYEAHAYRTTTEAESHQLAGTY